MMGCDLAFDSSSVLWLGFSLVCSFFCILLASCSKRFFTGAFRLGHHRHVFTLPHGE